MVGMELKTGYVVTVAFPVTSLDLSWLPSVPEEEKTVDAHLLSTGNNCVIIGGERKTLKWPTFTFPWWTFLSFLRVFIAAYAGVLHNCYASSRFPKVPYSNSLILGACVQSRVSSQARHQSSDRTCVPRQACAP